MKKTIYLTFMVLAGLIFIVPAVQSQNDYNPTEENLEAREWFQDAKFGMFIHWGVYSVLGDGEWVMNNQQINKATYEKLPAFFNPIQYDPEEWVALAKAAGMKYITITSKHHDGFAMYDSKHTDWDIVDRTPYGQDVLKKLAEECHKEGIKLFFYYSHLDWYQNDYYPRGRTGQHTGRPDKGNWKDYIDFMNGQLRELLTNYGEIGGIWFDGWWDKPDANWGLQNTYSMIHDLQPHALIGNNHHRAPKPGEDIQMFEKGLPGQSPYQSDEDAGIGDIALETCETINNSWGFNLQDKDFKSKEDLIHYLVNAAGYNSNFLLNVGPMPNGKIQQEFITRLRSIGEWLDQFGESIYGTRGGPVEPQDWGVTTQKDGRIFIHLLEPKGSSFLLPKLDNEVKSITLMHNGNEVDFEETGYGTVIEVPDNSREMIDVVMKVKVKQ